MGSWEQIWDARHRAAEGLQGWVPSEVRPSTRAFATYALTGRRGLSVTPAIDAGLGEEADHGRVEAFDDAEVAALALSGPGAGDQLKTLSPGFEALPLWLDLPAVAPAQVYEARSLGADALSLWPALCDSATLREISRAARATHLEPVPVVWDDAGLEKALVLEPRVIALRGAPPGEAQDPARAGALVDALPPRLGALLCCEALEGAARWAGRVDGLIVGADLLPDDDALAALIEDLGG